MGAGGIRFRHDARQRGALVVLRAPLPAVRVAGMRSPLGLLLVVRRDGLLWVAGILLWILPLLFFGPSNDLVMRASIPALLVLALASADVLAAPAEAMRRKVFWPIVVVLVLGVPTAATEITRAIVEPAWKPDLDEEPDRSVGAIVSVTLCRWTQGRPDAGLAEARRRTCPSSVSGSPGIHRRGSAVKAVILAGGVGSRLMEETAARPKPMVEIGGKPILWHIMKIYSALRHQRLRDLPRVSRVPDQGVLRELRAAPVGRDDRPDGQQS